VKERGKAAPNNRSWRGNREKCLGFLIGLHKVHRNMKMVCGRSFPLTTKAERAHHSQISQYLIHEHKRAIIPLIPDLWSFVSGRRLEWSMFNAPRASLGCHLTFFPIVVMCNKTTTTTFWFLLIIDQMEDDGQLW
jgi:hypothetical protein